MSPWYIHFFCSSYYWTLSSSPTGLHPPLRLTRRSNRGHTEGRGLDPLLGHMPMVLFIASGFSTPVLCREGGWPVVKGNRSANCPFARYPQNNEGFHVLRLAWERSRRDLGEDMQIDTAAVISTLKSCSNSRGLASIMWWKV